MAKSAVALKAKPVAVDTLAISNFRIAPENPRTIRPKASIESLAQNLAAEGQLQPVICYREDKDDIAWRYITVGGTRLLAAQHAGIPALWFEELPKEAAIRAGLAEQEGHTVLHPADQARAYAAELERLNGEGPLVREAAIETLAKRVGKTPRFVAQRLALAALHPPILAALAEDLISVKQAEAWANADVERQAELWAKDPKRAASDHYDAREIKDMIDKADVGEADRLAKFVGEDAYKAAGGMVRQDLFDVDLEPWEAKRAAKGHLDRALIQKLAKEKLAKAKEKLEAEGWGEVKTTLGRSTAMYTEQAKPKTKAERAKYRAEISIDDKGKLVTVRGLRIKTQEATGKPAAPTPEKLQQDKRARDEREATAQVAEQIVGRTMRNRPGVALAALLAALTRQLILGRYYAGLLDMDVNSRGRNFHGLASDDVAEKWVSTIKKRVAGHLGDMEEFIANEMSDSERGDLLSLLVVMLMDLGSGDEIDVDNKQQLGALSRLAGVDLDSHLTDTVADKVDMTLLRELVGLEAPKAKAKPAKKSAKAKK